MDSSREALKRAFANGPSTGANLIRQGKGRLIIDKMQHFIAKNTGYETYAVRMQIKSSESYPNAKDRDTGNPEVANPPGSSVSQLFQMNNPENKSSPSNMLSFISALVGSEFADADEYAGVVLELFNEDPAAKDAEGGTLAVNPYRGFELRYETYQKKIRSGKNAGKDGTFLNWFHVDTSDADIATNKGLLEGKIAA